MPVLYLVILGAAVGFLAVRIQGAEIKILPTVAIGILGGLIGGLVFRFLSVISGALGGVIGAFLGAMFLVWLWKRYAGQDK